MTSAAGKIAVIGSNSFSGATFVAFCLRQGAEVIGISRSVEPERAFLPYRWGNGLDRFRFHALDLNHHLDEIMAVLAKERPGYVVNFAAQSMVGQSWQFPEHWFTTNVVSTVQLHNRLRQVDYLERYIHVSTPEVYGNTSNFISEDAPFNPSTPYAVSRAAADMSIRTFVDTFGFPAVSTRAANVYGPGQQLYRIIPRTILFIRLGRRLSLEGGGRSRRSFVYMDDVSAATWEVMRRGKPGETYHISTDNVLTIRMLVELICRIMGADFNETVEIAGDRPGKDGAYLLDSSKIRNELGWKNIVDLTEGLGRCVEWVDANMEVLRGQEFDYVHKP